MKKNKLKSAYSLLELSIVIIIISILISGAMSVSMSGVNSAKVRVTKDRMQEIYKALGNYLIANRRLPCPASLVAIESTDEDYGSEVFDSERNCASVGMRGIYNSTSTNVIYGAVPVKSLGLSNEMAKDAFDSKIAYLISPDFAILSPDVADLFHPNFSSTAVANTVANLIVIAEVPSSTPQMVTGDAIVVLISYGANKSGAFNANSNVQNPRSVDANEMENDVAGDRSEEHNNIIITAAGNSDIFDDIVLYKRRNDFVEDFKAMFLIPCSGSTPTISSGVLNFISDSAYYGQIVTNPSCVAPAVQTRKCEAYGAWINIESDCR